jgi:hypothetical protein
MIQNTGTKAKYTLQFSNMPPVIYHLVIRTASLRFLSIGFFFLDDAGKEGCVVLHFFVGYGSFLALNVLIYCQCNCNTSNIMVYFEIMDRNCSSKTG